MSTFHPARASPRAPLDAPERNELQSAQTDDHDEVMQLAHELVARGFAVPGDGRPDR